MGLLIFGCSNEFIVEFLEYDVCIYGGIFVGVIVVYVVGKFGFKILFIEFGIYLGGFLFFGLGFMDIGNKYVVIGLSCDFYCCLGDYYGIFEVWIFEFFLVEKIFEEYIVEVEVDVWWEYCL